VHVLRREREMHPLQHVGEAGVLELELDEIFDRFHVVVGRRNTAMTFALELPDDLRVVDRYLRQRAKKRLLAHREGTYPDALGLRESREIFTLDDDAHFHERVFTEIVRERFGRAAIAAVDGANGGQRFEDHERLLAPLPADCHVKKWPIMTPLSACPRASLAAIKGVLTDIDETVSTDGRLTAEAYASLAALKQAGLLVVPVTGRPAGWCDMIARFWPVDAVVG